jgi:hypothetical protein
VKHSPGPWRLNEHVSPYNAWTVYDTQGYVVASMGKRGAMTVPNAHLIAAAPELLHALEVAAQALQEALDAGEFWQENAKDDLPALRATLAKARGEQK